MMENVEKIKNPFGENIVQVDGEIPVDLPTQDGEVPFSSHDQSYLTHGCTEIKLPRWLIKNSQENEIILDPFTGSGTTNVEALSCKRNSVGIDVDPFSRFIAKVKVTPLSESSLKSAQKKLFENINYDSSLIAKSDLPNFPYRDNWFNKEILLELSYLRKQGTT